MATKKRPRSKSPTLSVTSTDKESGPAKPALTQATDTIKALTALVESKPVVASVETPAPVEMAAVVAKIVDGPVQEAVTRVFAGNPDREFTVNAVIEELKSGDPGINENSIRFTITELKRKSVIHHVRNEGHYQILKFTKPGEEKPFPKPTLLAKPVTKSAVKAPPAAVASDLAVLKEAMAVISKLQALVQRNQEILTQISKLRAVL